MSGEQKNSLGQYAIVRFIDENSNSMKIIDLVPSSWIYEVDQKEYFCLYPDSTDYHHLNNWLISLKSPENHWDSYAITILAYAKDLKQGKRRLKRALKSDNVKSTDDDMCNINEESVMMLCKDSLENQLNAVKPFLTIDGSPSTSSLRVSNKTETKKKQENVLSSKSIAVLPIINEGTTAEILNEQEISVDVTHYIDQKFQQLQKELISQILSTKRSILYDLDKKINEVKHTIIINQPIADHQPQMSIEILKEALTIALPTVSLDHFLQLENLLTQKKEALMALFRVLITTDSNLKENISKVMSSIMTKAVELQYSGTGKVINGQSKRNFSNTNSYMCLRDVLIEKFGNSVDLKKLPGQVGLWLSRARDREGGRKERNKND